MRHEDLVLSGGSGDGAMRAGQFDQAAGNRS
jgi:hypothetical protein